jgi:hypothetical protein
MNRKITLSLLIFLFLAIPCFAEANFTEFEQQIPEYVTITYIAVAVPGENNDFESYEIPHGILNNEFHLESVRLTRLAHETYDFGDYDASAGFAEEAIRYTMLSDEFVSSQLITEAKRLLDWADSNNIANRHPNDYNESKNYYEAGFAAHYNDEWEEAISLTIRSISIMTLLETGGTSPLPAQYIVRPWATSRDCLWNIAGYSWVYGEPRSWRVLYEANKSKLPDPDNPNWIEPGMVLDIPSLSGEVRQGIYDSGRNYGR